MNEAFICEYSLRHVAVTQSSTYVALSYPYCRHWVLALYRYELSTTSVVILVQIRKPVCATIGLAGFPAIKAHTVFRRTISYLIRIYVLV